MNVLRNSSLFKVMKSAVNGCSSVFTLTRRCPFLSPEMDACEYMFLNTAATRFSFHIISTVHSGHNPLTSGFYPDWLKVRLALIPGQSVLRRALKFSRRWIMNTFPSVSSQAELEN